MPEKDRFSAPDDPTPPSAGGSLASEPGSLLAAILAEASAMPDERRDEMLAKLPEEKRQRIMSALGTLRPLSNDDLERAIASDREWSAGLPRWKQWIARGIIRLTEAILRRRPPP